MKKSTNVITKETSNESQHSICIQRETTLTSTRKYCVQRPLTTVG